MYLSVNSSQARVREAEAARKNRAEIVKALSTGQVSRRELFKWGIFTSAGMLANINGLSPFAPSAFAQSVGTGIPRSPFGAALPFTQKMPRLKLQTPIELRDRKVAGETILDFQAHGGELPAKRLSYHTEFTATGEFTNPQNQNGPAEGRPPGEWFAHQRWEEYLPKKAYIMSLAPVHSGTKFHELWPEQEPNKVWTFGDGHINQSMLPPPLIKVRYGEPVIFRHYNMLPHDPNMNGGFGSNSQATHNHNGHNASGKRRRVERAFLPGPILRLSLDDDPRTGRHDQHRSRMTDQRASGPDGNGGLVHVPGDFRELQSSLWFHDHRFFYTAENVYKGHSGCSTYYSGPDRGNEEHRTTA